MSGRWTFDKWTENDRESTRAHTMRELKSACNKCSLMEYWIKTNTRLAVNACISCRQASAHTHKASERARECASNKKNVMMIVSAMMNFGNMLEISFNWECVCKYSFLSTSLYIHLEFALDRYPCHYCCCCCFCKSCCFHCLMLMNYWNFCKISNSTLNGNNAMNTHITEGLGRGCGSYSDFLKNLGSHLLRVNVLYIWIVDSHTVASPMLLLSCISISIFFARSNEKWARERKTEEKLNISYSNMHAFRNRMCV